MPLSFVPTSKKKAISNAIELRIAIPRRETENVPAKKSMTASKINTISGSNIEMVDQFVTALILPDQDAMGSFVFGSLLQHGCCHPR